MKQTLLLLALLYFGPFLFLGPLVCPERAALASEGAASSLDLASPSEPGDPLVIEGTLYEADGETPVSDLLIHVYHTDAEGYYSPNNTRADNPRIQGDLHTDAEGRGINGVVIEAQGVDAGTLHEIALHIAFAKPAALTRDEVAAEDIEKEREAALGVTKAEGKPEAAWDKIVEGRVNKWLSERVLLEQGVFGEKETVEQKIGSGSITRFVQAYIGE